MEHSISPGADADVEESAKQDIEMEQVNDSPNSCSSHIPNTQIVSEDVPIHDTPDQDQEQNVEEMQVDRPGIQTDQLGSCKVVSGSGNTSVKDTLVASTHTNVDTVTSSDYNYNCNTVRISCAVSNNEDIVAIKNVVSNRDADMTNVTSNQDTATTNVTSNHDNATTNVASNQDTVTTNVTSNQDTVKTNVTSNQDTVMTNVTSNQDTATTNVTLNQDTATTNVASNQDTDCNDTAFNVQRNLMKEQILGTEEVSSCDQTSNNTSDDIRCVIPASCESKTECEIMEDHDKQVQSAVLEFSDSNFSFQPASPLRCVNMASEVFTESGEGNFLRGCKWSPDGTQVVTNSNDNVLRIFTPDGGQHESGTAKEMRPDCEIREGGLVYDFCWFPHKSHASPESCRLASTCPGSPVHLWDSNLGKIVSSYKAFDQADELTSAYSVSFSPDGSKIYAGYKSCVRVFDTEYSHHRCSTIRTFDSKTKEGQRGIISCFCHGPPESRLFVAGSYSRHVGIFHSLTNELLCLIQGQQGGITHVMCSPDGSKLYTGGRKDPEIVCWDMRNLGQILCTFLRDVQTNQRILFDLSQSGRYLVSGNHDGSVQTWDTTQPGQEVQGEVIMKPCHTFQAHRDCVNGVSLNPHSPSLATASGQRHFKAFDGESDSEDAGTNVDPDNVKDFSLKIWTIPLSH